MKDVLQMRDELYERPWYGRNDQNHSAVGQLADGSHPQATDPVVLTVTKQQAAKAVISAVASAAYALREGNVRVAAESLEIAGQLGDQAFPLDLQPV